MIDCAHSALLNIIYNIVGGILTIAVTVIVGWSLRTWRRRRFRQAFGDSRDLYQLVFAALKLHPNVKKALPHEFLRPGGEPFVFVRSDTDNASFSASQVASACEIRAASYIAAALGKDGGRESTFVDCDSVASKLDIDFVSFGLISNRKTIDVFRNPANNLVNIVMNPDFVASRGTGKSLISDHREGLDYGIILKIHPIQFPKRTWIACAGMGEFGTSGAAWFLARKWKELDRPWNDAKCSFAIVAVEPGKDESAILVNSGRS